METKFEAPVLIASNKVKFTAFSRLIVAVISISLSYILSLKYGSIGAGVAIFIGNMVGSVLVLNIIYSRVLKINVWKFFKECQLKMAFPFILVILAGIVMNYYLIDVSWTRTFIKVTILAFIYTVSAYFTAMNNYEKNLILGVFRRKINN